MQAASTNLVEAEREGAVEADFAFHRALARATGNRFYVDLLDSLGPMMIMLPRTRLADAYSMTDATHVERVQREHDNIAAAVLAGDVETARGRHAPAHLGNTRRRLDPQGAEARGVEGVTSGWCWARSPGSTVRM